MPKFIGWSGDGRRACLHSQSVEIIGPEKAVELLKSLLVQDGGHREFVVVEDLEIEGLHLFSDDALVLLILVVISRMHEVKDAPFQQ